MIIKRFFKICDLYGTHFHWYIGYKPKLYTIYGGIFSILSIFFWIAIFLLFEFNNLKRTHPVISSSTFPPKGYRNIKFGQEKLYLPWRIIDYDERFINHKGIIYPKIYYFTRTLNKSNGEIDTNYTLLNYKLCNETNMINLGKEFLLDINLSELYCIDMEDLNMGGSFNAEFINYIRLDIYLCENGIKYNESNDKCTSIDKFEELHGKDNAWFFEVLYPKVQFQPNEVGIPLLILYQTYYYIFGRYSNKLDRIYLQEHVLEDDKGWVFNLPRNVSYWGTYSIGGENYYRGENDILKYGSNSRLYSLKIYLNLGISFYTRKYKKLYEIFSEIFLVVKAITALFSYLSEEMNDIYSSKKVNELIMNIEQKHKNYNNINKPKIDFFKGTKTPTFINFKLERNSYRASEIQFEKKILFNKSKKDNRPNGIDDSSNLDIKNILNNSIHSHSQRNSNFRRRSVTSINKYERIKYPLKYYLKINILMKFKCKQKFNKYLPANFMRSFVIYRNLIDISSYINLYKQFEIVKKIVLNHNTTYKDTHHERKEEIVLIDKNKEKKF